MLAPLSGPVVWKSCTAGLHPAGDGALPSGSTIFNRRESRRSSVPHAHTMPVQLPSATQQGFAFPIALSRMAFRPLLPIIAVVER